MLYLQFVWNKLVFFVLTQIYVFHYNAAGAFAANCQPRCLKFTFTVFSMGWPSMLTLSLYV